MVKGTPPPRFADADLPEPVWAAALEVNWGRKVADLVDDIYGDHAYMVGDNGLKSVTPSPFMSMLHRIDCFEIVYITETHLESAILA